MYPKASPLEVMMIWIDHQHPQEGSSVELVEAESSEYFESGWPQLQLEYRTATQCFLYVGEHEPQM